MSSLGTPCHVSLPTTNSVDADERSAILASFLLHEELGHLGRLGCSLCLLGSLIIVLHAPPDKEVKTVDEILEYAVHPGAHYSPRTSPSHRSRSSPHSRERQDS